MDLKYTTGPHNGNTVAQGVVKPEILILWVA